MASADVNLKYIRQRLRVAVSQEEKWYLTILRVICLYHTINPSDFSKVSWAKTGYGWERYDRKTKQKTFYLS